MVWFADLSFFSLVTKDHVQKSYERAKQLTSEAARLQLERMYASFLKARDTDFAVAEANAIASCMTSAPGVKLQITDKGPRLIKKEDINP